MRLFVALDVGEEVRRRAQRVIDRLERQLRSSSSGRVHQSSPVRWVRIDQLHLTLRFIGEVDEALGAEIETRLAPAYPTAPFEIALAGVGMFPPSGAPRVVWIGLTDGIDRVREVQAETVRRLAGLPIRPDDRPFSPHLTLGRFREFAARYRKPLADLDVLEAGRSTIDHVTLYQSRLSPKGPEYIARLQAPLSGSEERSSHSPRRQGGR